MEEQTINNLIKKIMEKSEQIGQWVFALRCIEDWSDPCVPVYQNTIRQIESERSSLVEQLKKSIKNEN